MAPFLSSLALFVASQRHATIQHESTIIIGGTWQKSQAKLKKRIFSSSTLTTRQVATPQSSSTLSSIDEHGNDNDRYDRLLDWVASKDGADVGPVKIRPSTSGIGYGMFLTRSVKKDEVLLKIPEEVCISERIFLLDDEVGSTLRTNIFDKAGPGGNIVCLAGWLAKEWMLYKLGKSVSDYEFETYLDILPWTHEDQEHILFWSDEEISSLMKGSIAEEDATGLLQEVDFARRVLGPLLLPIIAKSAGIETKPAISLPWLKDPEAEERQKELKKLFDAAVTGAFVIVLSRSFRDEDNGRGERLVPLLDMIQHATENNIRHQVNPKTFSVDVQARHDMEEGSELFNQYLKNEEMLPYKFFTRFGFVPDVNESGKTLLQKRDERFFPTQAPQQAEV